MAEEEATRADTQADTVEDPAPPTPVTGPLQRARPQKIGRYHVKRVIASGGMGTVYEAVQEQPRRTVAVKVMKQGLTSRSALRRFEYEAQILARLRHPGIAQVYEAGVHDEGFGGVPYFAMEYIAGAREIIDYAASKELSTRQRLELFIKVCEAIHHGHQKGIVHRDLKPANILVDSTGQPKIIDFGVARATDSDLAVTTLQTDVGQLVGTVQYMSPEQIDADPHDIDTRSDVYALGVVLYKLLTRRLPYDVTGTVIYEATRMIREQQPARISSIDRTLRGDVETIVLHALEKDRDRRYQSALDLAHDIRRYLDNRTIMARPPSVAYQFRTFVKRNKALVAGIAAVFAALVIGTIGTATGWFRAEAQRQIAATQRDRAERMFGQVRELARTFMFDFHDEISQLNGSLRARTLMVETALRYLDGLSREVGDDASLRRELASAYDRVGDIRGGLRTASGTDAAGALENYRTSLQLRQVLAAETPADPVLRKDLATSHIKVGDLLERTGQAAAALASYQEAVTIQEDLARADAGAESRRGLAIGLQNVAGGYYRNGDAANARATFERSLRLRREIANENPLPELAPGNPQLDPANDEHKRLALYQRDVSVALIGLGDLLYELGESEEALRYFDEALEVREHLFRLMSRSVTYRRDVAIAHYFAGRALLDLNRTSEAMEHVSLLLQSAQEARAKNPGTGRFEADLALAHIAVGRATAQMGDHTAAREHFEKAGAILEPLVEDDAGNALYQKLGGEAKACLGDCAQDAADGARAVAHYREAIAVYDALVAEDTHNMELRGERARVEVKLGAALAATGELGEARQRLDSARAFLAERLAVRPDDKRLRGELTQTLVHLSRLAVSLDDGAAAKRHAEEALATAPRGPSPELYQALAAARFTGGDAPGAADAVEKALRLIDEGRGGPVAMGLRADLERDLARYRR